MTLRLEGVLATVDWAHVVLTGSGQSSGYAMDLRPKRLRGVDTRELRSERPQSPGLFARYLRGDTAPSYRQLLSMDGWVEGASSRINLPIYRVLAKPTTEWCELVEVLGDVALSLHCKVFDVSGPQGPGMYQLPTTSRRQTDLAAQGDGFALTALLVLALNAKSEENHSLALDIATRAYQCMVMAFARGEFSSIRSAISVRVRQQVLDQIECDGIVLDTASLDIETGMIRLRELLEQNHLEEHAAGDSARRRLFREILAGSHPGVLSLITPARVPLAVATRLRSQHRRPINIDSLPRGRFRHVSRFGKRARNVLRANLGDYWVD